VILQNIISNTVIQPASKEPVFSLSKKLLKIGPTQSLDEINIYIEIG
jgi:hypothetical protein